MDKITKLKTYLSKVDQIYEQAAQEIVDKYEKSLPEDLQGLFEYGNFHFNGDKFHCLMTCLNVEMYLCYDVCLQKYHVMFADNERMIDKVEEVARRLLSRIEKQK